MENVLIKHNVPLDWDEQLPEPCRYEMTQLIWTHIPDVVESTFLQRLGVS